MALQGVVFSGCAQRPDKTNLDDVLQPADLRLLKLDETGAANHQIIAAYARLTAADLDLRVDFLGSPAPLDYDLYEVVYDRPGGSRQLPLEASTDLAWDLALGMGQGSKSPCGIRPTKPVTSMITSRF